MYIYIYGVKPQFLLAKGERMFIMYLGRNEVAKSRFDSDSFSPSRSV